MYAAPGRMQPTPTPAQLPSPPPTATGVPSFSPVSPAACRVMTPRMAVDSMGSGNFSPSRAARSTIFSDQRNVFRSKALVPEASE